MSKYHKGDKFIVEIKEVINSDNGTLYRSDFSTLVFNDYGLDSLHQAITPAEDGLVDKSKVDEAYNKGLNDGRNEVFKLAKKIVLNQQYGGLSIGELKKIFGFGSPTEILRRYTLQEALAKLEAYEKEQEKVRQKIMVGDIVTLEDGTKGVVMDEDGVDNVVIFTENGCIEAWMNKKYITKTGKHIDIHSVLEQIKE